MDRHSMKTKADDSGTMGSSGSMGRWNLEPSPNQSYQPGHLELRLRWARLPLDP
jgi:hypothetical protein